MNTQTDEAIVSLVKKGDTASFGILVERYEEKMIRYGRRFLSNRDDLVDLVQEVFIKAFTNIQGFDTSLRFSPWLYRIAHNEFVNALKKKKKEPLSFFDDVDTLFPHLVSEKNLEDEAEQKEMRLMLEKFLDKLPSKYREPVVLYHFEEMSYQEISEILHIPISTVGVRLGRAKKQLQRFYSKSQQSS